MGLKDVQAAVNEIADQVNVKVANQVKPKKNVAELYADIEARFRDGYIQLVPAWSDRDHLLNCVLMELKRMPQDALYDPRSKEAMMKIFSSGLNPLFGEIALIPRRDKRGGFYITSLITYRGMITLALKSGLIKTIYSQTVHNGDEIDISFSPPNVSHRIVDLTTPRDESTFIGVWALAELSNGDKIVEYCPKVEIDYLRSLSNAENFSPWTVNYTAMARAKVLKKMLNRFPVLNLSSFEDEIGDAI